MTHSAGQSRCSLRGWTTGHCLSRMGSGPGTWGEVVMRARGWSKRGRAGGGLGGGRGRDGGRKAGRDPGGGVYKQSREENVKKRREVGRGRRGREPVSRVYSISGPITDNLLPLGLRRACHRRRLAAAHVTSYVPAFCGIPRSSKSPWTSSAAA